MSMLNHFSKLSKIPSLVICSGGLKVNSQLHCAVPAPLLFFTPTLSPVQERAHPQFHDACKFTILLIPQLPIKNTFKKKLSNTFLKGQRFAKTVGRISFFFFFLNTMIENLSKNQKIGSHIPEFSINCRSMSRLLRKLIFSESSSAKLFYM